MCCCGRPHVVVEYTSSDSNNKYCSNDNNNFNSVIIVEGSTIKE